MIASCHRQRSEAAIQRRATDKQLATIAAMEAAGAFTAIAEGLDRALACLEAWDLLRGRAL